MSGILVSFAFFILFENEKLVVVLGNVVRWFSTDGCMVVRILRVDRRSCKALALVVDNFITPPPLTLRNQPLDCRMFLLLKVYSIYLFD